MIHSGHVEGFLETRAATWGGPVRGLTEFDALKECIVKFIWAKHAFLNPMDDSAMYPG